MICASLRHQRDTELDVMTCNGLYLNLRIVDEVLCLNDVSGDELADLLLERAQSVTAELEIELAPGVLETIKPSAVATGRGRRGG